ncbi:MAG: phosphatase PAP2 family protein, partial [Jatrophihabitantaceae bacterium]
MEQSTGAPRTPRVPWRVIAFVLILTAYVLLTIGVIHRSPLLTLDRDVFRLDMRDRFPGWFYGIHTFVMLGQRAPATLVALPWFVWRAWKSRSSRPLVMLATALVVLNLSVGIVKVATGRLGPRATHQVHAVFEGGDIFPSGHVSNAVVLYGVIAMLAVSFHRTAIAMAGFLSLTIGLSTIYLDTHWLTDVLGGWLAGGLVLVALPWLMPYTQQLADWAERRARRLFATWRADRRRPAPVRPPAVVDRAAGYGSSTA